MNHYYIETNLDEVELQWTTEPPTVEGWYWAIYKLKEPMPEIVYILNLNLSECVNVIGDGTMEKIESFDRWLGPLPLPESPK